MPFTIIHRGNQFLVITKGSEKVHGHFATRSAAAKQLRALYANVPEASQPAKARKKSSR
jgi:hypothetical protein